MHLTKLDAGYNPPMQGACDFPRESGRHFACPIEEAIAYANEFVPVQIMKFTLTYTGQLPASGNGNSRAAEKWTIRKHLHPQLVELYQTHPVLRGRTITAIATPPSFSSGTDHGIPITFSVAASGQAFQNIINATIDRGTERFIPLVRQSLGLACELNITFLRKEEPGSLILQGGDLDNRLKTLFDALKVPGLSDMRAGSPEANPFYCVMEEDAMITAVNIKTDRLLTKPSGDVTEVHLVIEVAVRVLHFSMDNIGFITD
jgi:hypothetical protein